MEIEDSPNGYYPIIVVPTDLVGRRVLIVPISEEDRPYLSNIRWLNADDKRLYKGKGTQGIIKKQADKLKQQVISLNGKKY